MKNIASILTSLLCILPASALAQDSVPVGVWFAGGTVSESPSAYGGAVIALPGGQLGKGLAVRAAANVGHYEYSNGNANINADYKGGEIALVYQTSGSWGWTNFSAGPRYTDTSLDPFDPGNKSAGSQWDLGLQADGARDGQKWRFGWYGSYTVDDEEYQARIQLVRKLENSRFRIGVETAIQGNPSYTKFSIGGLVGIGLGKDMDLQISSGISEQGGRKARAYATVGISQLF